MTHGTPIRVQHETYEEAFVSPANPTGALFQLMRFEATYPEHYASDEVFVNDRPVEDAFDD